jgi:hypothetical protein
VPMLGQDNGRVFAFSCLGRKEELFPIKTRGKRENIFAEVMTISTIIGGSSCGMNLIFGRDRGLVHELGFSLNVTHQHNKCHVRYGKNAPCIETHPPTSMIFAPVFQLFLSVVLSNTCLEARLRKHWKYCVLITCKHPH